MQSGPIKRDIYIRPRRKCNSPKGTLWKLLKLSYGIVEAGRRGAAVFEDWLLESARLACVRGTGQLYLKESALNLFAAKITDDFLIAEEKKTIFTFFDCLKKRFNVRKPTLEDPFSFNCCKLRNRTTNPSC